MEKVVISRVGKTREQVMAEVEATEAVWYLKNLVGNGYEVSSPFWRYEICSLRLSPKHRDADGNKTFLPNINIDVEDGAVKVGVSMAAYGTLYGDDLERWAKANERAMTIVRVLQKNNVWSVFDLPEIVD